MNLQNVISLVIGMHAFVYGQVKGDVTIMFRMFCLFKCRRACLLQQDGLSF